MCLLVSRSTLLVVWWQPKASVRLPAQLLLYKHVSDLALGRRADEHGSRD